MNRKTLLRAARIYEETCIPYGLGLQIGSAIGAAFNFTPWLLIPAIAGSAMLAIGLTNPLSRMLDR